MPYRRIPLEVPQLVGILKLRGMPGLEPEVAEAVARAWDESMFPLQRYLESLGGSQDESIPAGQYDEVPEIVGTAVGDVGDPTDGWSPGTHRHQVLVGDPVGLGDATGQGGAAGLADAAHVHARILRAKHNGAGAVTQRDADFKDTGGVVWTIGQDLPNDEVDIEANLSAEYKTFERGGTAKNATGLAVDDAIVWEAPWAAEVLNVRALRRDGTGATINMRKNFTSEHLSSDLSLVSALTTYDGGTVQNATYAQGDMMEVRIKSVAGAPSEIAIWAWVRRTG